MSLSRAEFPSEVSPPLRLGGDPHYRGGIGVTYSASFHANPNLSCTRFSNRPFHYSKLARLIDFYCLVCVFYLPVPFVCIPV